MIDPGYSRVQFKQDTELEGYLFRAGVVQEFADTILTSHCGPLEDNPAFDVLENGHAIYNAARAQERAEQAPENETKPRAKKASK